MNYFLIQSKKIMQSIRNQLDATESTCWGYHSRNRFQTAQFSRQLFYLFVTFKIYLLFLQIYKEDVIKYKCMGRILFIYSAVYLVITTVQISG